MKKVASTCPKAGVRIHETPASSSQQLVMTIAPKQYPLATNNNKSITNTLSHYTTNGGKTTEQIEYHQNRIKYHQDQIQSRQQLVPMHQWPVTAIEQKPVDPMSGLDLNLANYEFQDIMKLFNISETILTEDIMKAAKRKVLKLHPDKCKMDPKYYEFFQQAYKQLEAVQSFQNTSLDRKNRGTSYSTTDVFDEDNTELVQHFFKQGGGSGGGFNVRQFNEQFEKCRVPDEADKGYDEWFKSDRDMLGNPDGKVSKSNMNSHIENIKREKYALQEYKGVSDNTWSGSQAGGVLLDTSKITNFGGTTSGDVFSRGGMVFTDLKQAYMETLIPVNEDDFYKRPQYRNVTDYSALRDQEAKTYKVMSKGESDLYVRMQEREQGLAGANTAMFLAKQENQSRQQNQLFWNNLKQLTYGSG